MPKPEPTITLTQLIEQLKKWEGQTIAHAGGLAVAIMKGAADDA